MAPLLREPTFSVELRSFGAPQAGRARRTCATGTLPKRLEVLGASGITAGITALLRGCIEQETEGVKFDQANDELVFEPPLEILSSNKSKNGWTWTVAFEVRFRHTSRSESRWLVVIYGQSSETGATDSAHVCVKAHNGKRLLGTYNGAAGEVDGWYPCVPECEMGSEWVRVVAVGSKKGNESWTDFYVNEVHKGRANFAVDWPVMGVGNIPPPLSREGKLDPLAIRQVVGSLKRFEVYQGASVKAEDCLLEGAAIPETLGCGHDGQSEGASLAANKRRVESLEPSASSSSPSKKAAKKTAVVVVVKEEKKETAASRKKKKKMSKKTAASVVVAAPVVKRVRRVETALEHSDAQFALASRALHAHGEDAAFSAALGEDCPRGQQIWLPYFKTPAGFNPSAPRRSRQEAAPRPTGVKSEDRDEVEVFKDSDEEKRKEDEEYDLQMHHMEELLASMPGELVFKFQSACSTSKAEDAKAEDAAMSAPPKKKKQEGQLREMVSEHPRNHFSFPLGETGLLLERTESGAEAMQKLHQLSQLSSLEVPSGSHAGRSWAMLDETTQTNVSFEAFATLARESEQAVGHEAREEVLKRGASSPKVTAWKPDFLNKQNSGCAPPLWFLRRNWLTYLSDRSKRNVFRPKLALMQAGALTTHHRDNYGAWTWIKVMGGSQLVATWSMADGDASECLGDLTQSKDQAKDSFTWAAFVNQPSARLTLLEPGDFFMMRPGTYHRVLTLHAKVQMFGEFLSPRTFHESLASVVTDMQRPETLNACETSITMADILCGGLKFEFDRRRNAKNVHFCKAHETLTNALALNKAPALALTKLRWLPAETHAAINRDLGCEMDALCQTAIQLCQTQKILLAAQKAADKIKKPKTPLLLEEPDHQ